MFYPSAFALAILFLLAFFGIAILTIYLLHARSWLRDLEDELELRRVVELHQEDAP